ncbi:MAG: cation:proton antiporter [Alphaproteobacteria bacterium]
MTELWLTSAVWMALAVAASLFSVRFGVTVALGEVVLGIVAGNVFGLEPTPWIAGLAAFGAVVLMFLAGAEIDRASLRADFRFNLTVGLSSFAVPTVGGFALAHGVLGWSWPASAIAGLVLSETSVAITYVLLLELGLARARIGQAILSASFVTNLCTVTFLGLIFLRLDPQSWLALGGVGVALAFAPVLARRLFPRLGPHGSEPQLRIVIGLLFALAAAAARAGGEAVLPAYLLGLVLGPALAVDRAMLVRLRGVAFAVLTPFFFLKAGVLMDMGAVMAGAGTIAALFAIKFALKFGTTWAFASHIAPVARDRAFLGLMMSTGLTFGNVVALFGLLNGAVDKAQYSLLAAVTIVSAIIPAAIAQRWFLPRVGETDGRAL